jgi:uncharacterized protein YbjT (DUF2867 family)
MNVILFGATGMIGQGTLRELTLDAGVTKVLCVGRKPSGSTSPKVTDLVMSDLYDYSKVEPQLTGYDACLFCLGISSAGLSEAEYTHITYDLAVAAGKTLSRLNPTLTMCFISGASTDSSEKGRAMWARVKGKTENALLAMPFKGAYMFRPGAIQPLHGITSKTPSYRVMYAVLGPLLPLARKVFPSAVTDTETLGRAMIAVARNGYGKQVLESTDINAVPRT